MLKAFGGLRCKKKAGDQRTRKTAGPVTICSRFEKRYFLRETGFAVKSLTVENLNHLKKSRKWSDPMIQM